MASRYDIEGLILLLDVGHSMTNRIGSSTYLQSCVDMIQMIIQRKMFQASKDEIALVLFGTNETANPLWDGSSDDYSHVTVARQLSMVDWKLLDYVQNNVNATNVQGDLLDGLIVASDHFHQELNEKKNFREKRIIIYTDFSAPTDDGDKLSEICHGLAKHKIRVDLISPFADYDEDDDDDSNDDEKKKTTQASNTATNGSTDRKEMTRVQKENKATLKQILAATNGAMYSFDEVLTLLSMYQAKAIKSAGTKFKMTIGERFALPIQSIIKIKENKPELFRFKKVYAKDESVELKTDRARFTKDEEQRDLDETSDVVDAYRYGSSFIPIDSADSLRLNVEKCFSVLGFTRSELIKRYYYVGDSVHQIVPDASAGDEAEEAFVNLVHSMFEENVYGIVRKVFSSRSAPELGCLIPHIGIDVVCLYYIALPFEDDVRKFTLENFTLNKKLAPSDEQLALVDELIDCMDLQQHASHASAKMNGSRTKRKDDQEDEENDGDDDDDEAEELYDPSLTFNPYIQRMFQSIALRATQPDAELPDFKQNVTSRSQAKEQAKVFTDKTINVLKRMNEEFKFKVIDAKKQKTAGNGQNIFEMDSNKPKTSEPNEEALDSNDKNNDDGESRTLMLDDLLKRNDSLLLSRSKKIGTLTPDEDFKSLVESLLVTTKRDNKNDENEFDDEATVAFGDLCKQVQSIVKDLFNESLMQSTSSDNSSLVTMQEKVFNCIRMQRDYCVKLRQYETFNSYLRSFRASLLSQIKSSNSYAPHIRSFWTRFFLKHRLSFIVTSECAESDKSDEEAAAFLLGFEEPVIDSTKSTADTKDEVKEDDEENLLDLM